MDRPRVIPFAFPGLPRVRCAFQTRQGGFSRGVHGQGNIAKATGDDPEAVFANRRALREDLGFTHWQEAFQVHGTDLLFEPEPTTFDCRIHIEVDGMVTTRRQQALVIKTADCQPLLLAHESGEVVAGLHVGWKGNAQRYPQKALAAICERYGLEASGFLAVRGPSLGPGASEFVNFEREWDPAFAPYYDPGPRTVNLWRLTHDQLLEAGLRPDRIFSIDLCTRSLPELFFSYRRGHEPGRQGSFIWIE